MIKKFILFIIFTGSILYSILGQEQRRVWMPTVQDDMVFLYRDKMALVIGVGNYIYLPNLKYPLLDAEEVANVLRDLGFRVQILRDPASDELRRILRELPSTEIGSVADVALLIYIAGHGTTETLIDNTKLGYFIPRDCPPPNDQEFSVKAISMYEIVEFAKRLKNRHVLILFDSCFSGSIFNLMRAIPSPVKNIIAHPVRQFIVAGGENEEVPDESIFKRFFIRGIREGEADYNNDGFVTGTELGKYIQENVERYSNGRQHPLFGKIRELEGGDFVFVLPSNKSIMPSSPEPGDGIIRPSRERWYIYKDADSEENHGEWTNWMAEKDPGRMITLSLVEKEHPYSGSTCVRINMNLSEQSWGGIAVASLANYWGKTPSDFAYDLREAQRLVFHARGERGDEMIQVKVAIAGSEPYGDSIKTPISSRWIRLTTEWQRYELSVEGHNLRRVITPFAFVADRAHNSESSITFYLDEIYFEMR